MFTLEISSVGLTGFSLDDSHTLYCEFAIPRSLVNPSSEKPWGPMTLLTDDLNAVIGPASTRFAEHRSELMLEANPAGIRLRFHVPGALTRTKMVPDHAEERQHKLSLRELTKAAKASAEDSKLLSLAGATFSQEGPVRVSIGDGHLSLGPSIDDSLTFDVNSEGRATTTVLDRAFRIVNAYVQPREPPRLTFRVVDDGVLSFEAEYPFGATVRYVVTQVAQDQ